LPYPQWRYVHEFRTVQRSVYPHIGSTFYFPCAARRLVSPSFMTSSNRGEYCLRDLQFTVQQKYTRNERDRQANWYNKPGSANYYAVQTARESLSSWPFACVS